MFLTQIKEKSYINGLALLSLFFSSDNEWFGTLLYNDAKKRGPVHHHGDCPISEVKVAVHGNLYLNQNTKTNWQPSLFEKQQLKSHLSCVLPKLKG